MPRQGLVGDGKGGADEAPDGAECDSTPLPNQRKR